MEDGRQMVLAAEKEVICYSRKDTFQGNWKRESVIDWENQMFKTTRKDLEENQSLPYCSRLDFLMKY